MKQIEVVAAIIIYNNEIFCTQRPNIGEVALKWEFPGGKIEINESNEQALVREIKEELNCDITINEYFTSVKHQYKSFHLLMHCYKCTLISDKIILNDHIDYCWLPVNELKKLDWAPADLPIIRKLESGG